VYVVGQFPTLTLSELEVLMGRVVHPVHGLLGLIAIIIMIGGQASTSAQAADEDALRTISRNENAAVVLRAPAVVL
jgi:hypothetical protein